MAKQSFALETGGPRRLQIGWKGMYKEVTVWLDDTVVGVIPDQKALMKGQEFRLVDGSTLKVQLITKVYSSELQVLRNGQPLPGSGSDPNTKLKNAYLMVYFIGVLNLILGIISMLFKVQFLQGMGLGFGSILFGLVFLGLGYFVQRRSSFALLVAIVLFSIDAILGLVFSASEGYNPGGGIVARIILMIPMIQGVGAIKLLKTKTA